MNHFRCTLLVLCCLIQLGARASDRDEILAGVKTIAGPGAPGAICIFGADAFPVIAGQSNSGIQQAVIAAARVNKGRVVLFGHSGYFNESTAAQHDTGTLLANAIRWAAGKEKPRVGLLKFSNLRQRFEKAGSSVAALQPDKWHENLSSCDVIVMAGEAPQSDAQRAALKTFLENGGGILAASTPWGWAQVNPGKSLQTDHPGNRFFVETGLVFADGTPDKTTGEGFAADAVAETLNAHAALKFISGPVDAKGKGARKAIAQASQTLLHALRSLPPGEKVFTPRIDELIAKHAGDAVPSPAKPLKQMEHALARLVLTRQLIELERTPVEKIEAHPAAQYFPGAIAADAPRVTKSVEINARIPDWHSTGLYAAPGDKLTVTLPDGALGAKLSVRIGCHRDDLWHLDSWRRAPSIDATWLLKQGETRIASAFGGPVYIVVPKDCPLEKISIKVAGAVEAPHYVLGATTEEDWKKIRERPAPWAEMETPTVVFSVPAEFIRALDDPAPVMQFWVEFMDAAADLAAIERRRPRPERYVADTQISAGFMHSGYPIMMHYNEGKPCMNLDHLKTQDEPTWGYFHEMGHNHQRPDWTFSGTGEVTCNLFARYAFETVCKRPLSDQRGHKNGDFAKNFRRYLAGGVDFDKWKADPFLALYMYDQLRVAFGWETYKKVFAEYRGLPRDQQPKSEMDKRDQWMVRFSRAAGKNLGPFFEKWGVPTSDTARKSIAELPEWMPADWPQLKP